MTRAPKWLWFAARADKGDWIRLIVRVGLIAGVVGFLLLFTSIKVTEQPRFCNSCHIMEPYYEGWKTSSHKDVPCIQCHYAPGWESTIKGKMTGLRQLVTYFTGGAGTRPWAEIDDASCLRSGCHEMRLLEGEVDFNGIKFDHKPHLQDLKRGKKLRCTSCHSQVVQGEHITVTTSTCILCHFKNDPNGNAGAFDGAHAAPAEPGNGKAAVEPKGCLGCHNVPADTVILPGGREYNHSEVAERKVPCTSCHATLTKGEGFVPRNQCYVCHNLPNIDDYLDSPTFLHNKHVTEHKVECTDCHQEITHGFEAKRRTANLDCQACHANTHNATVKLTEGDIAAELGKTEPQVGPMLAARVECISCHTDTHAHHGPHSGSTMLGGKDGCVSCHGEESVRILRDWKAFFVNRIPQVERAVAASKASKEKIAKARQLVEIVKYGKGVHNPSLGRDLLDEAERLALGKGPRLKKPVEKDAKPEAGLHCGYCHLTAPEGEMKFGSLSFSHLPHTRNAEIDCLKCHEGGVHGFPKGRHGKVKMNEKDCSSCHHWQETRCASCHGEGPSTPVKFSGKDFPHANHVRKGISCDACHKKVAIGAKMASSIRIEDCASCHHTKGSTKACASCHLETLKVEVAFRNAKLPHKAHVELGLECGDCHKVSASGPALAADCGSCHHQEGTKPGCESCHGKGPAKAVPTSWQPFPHQQHGEIGVECSECHSKPGDPSKVEPSCDVCHEEARKAAAPPSEAPKDAPKAE